MSSESPCIAVCVIDPRTSLCRGCGRTLMEITDWGAMTSDERDTLMATLVQRMSDAGMEIPPGLVRWLAVC